MDAIIDHNQYFVSLLINEIITNKIDVTLDVMVFFFILLCVDKFMNPACNLMFGFYFDFLFDFNKLQIDETSNV